MMNVAKTLLVEGKSGKKEGKEVSSRLENVLVEEVCWEKKKRLRTLSERNEICLEQTDYKKSMFG